MEKPALFIGLITLDMVNLVDHIPSDNQKVIAEQHTVCAGGPATNAAVTFSWLGGHPILMGMAGTHPVTALIHSDLEERGVKLVNLDTTTNHPPPIASIMVNRNTGRRAIISHQTKNFTNGNSPLVKDLVSSVDLVLIDGHQMELGLKIAGYARKSGTPVVVDGGSWKPGFEKVLTLADYVVCSADFIPPSCSISTGNPSQIFQYIGQLGVPNIAITDGEKPIQYISRETGKEKKGEIKVKQIKAIDTLGAGDIFHGAFCHYILREDFISALKHSAAIATFSCNYFGTRQWMEQENNQLEASCGKVPPLL